MSAVLVDTHCHLDFESFQADRDAVVARARAAGVAAIIIPALDLSNLDAVLTLAEQYKDIYAAVGIHPNSTATWDERWLADLRDKARHPKVVAVGEIGLDYYWDKSPRATQHEAFTRQLALAAELDLPVIVHNRDATEDVLSLLAQSALVGKERAGVLHSFSADWAAAETALHLGFHIGITGPITFKKADELRRIALRAPLERILIETDAPFLTPQPYRGQRNEPAYVQHVAEGVAGVRSLPVAEVARQTSLNAVALFRLPLLLIQARDSR